MARRKRTSRRKILQAMSWIGIVIGVLVAIPLILTPLYLVINPLSVPMLERYVTGRPVTREWRDIETISDRLKATVIMSEDGQFCRHWGVDLAALRDEINNLMAGEKTRGASTLTMQVARNLFLTNARNPLRKLLEIPLAIYVDLIIPKKRIMEIYLNIAEWGPDGQFGIVAGTEAAFGDDATAMTWRRAALMTTALPNPLLRRPAMPSSGMNRIATILINRTREYGQRAACVASGTKLAL
ncbi:transglycosylase domain-containing protein [Devosia rhodophyticola]|uniref:Transglycosylase domain-containing protein n=1 Tax=Devosia rhodophyticola TaxID=3026423 RepID=A0ABY7YU18_9HYPH|nr:transglycosylase domain-containing protein [Devosia rhodophyticola]WDR04603.1 transglycosylase domain-containing protein [Devosia rhodophyticola]